MRINCSVSVPSRISSHILTWLTLFSDCSDSSYHVLEYSVGQLVLTPRLYLDLSASSFSQSIISIITSYPGPHSPGANPINQKIPDSYTSSLQPFVIQNLSSNTFLYLSHLIKQMNWEARLSWMSGQACFQITCRPPSVRVTTPNLAQIKSLLVANCGTTHEFQCLSWN